LLIFPYPAISDDLTITGLTRAVETKPAVLAILMRHEIKPRDYVLGSIALSNALLAVTQAESEDEDLLFDEPVMISPENLEFGRHYSDRIRALHGG